MMNTPQNKIHKILKKSPGCLADFFKKILTILQISSRFSGFSLRKYTNIFKKTVRNPLKIWQKTPDTFGQKSATFV